MAVFYSLRERVSKTKGKIPAKKAAENIFENLLQIISVQEYQAFIRSYAEKHKNFKTEFELHFAAEDHRIDVAKKYEDLVSKIIRKHSDRAFVDYHASLPQRIIKLYLPLFEKYGQKANNRSAYADLKNDAGNKRYTTRQG